jgi:DNA-binding PadR family transcriptional regulator
VFPISQRVRLLLKNVILTVLHQQPSTGYEITQAFDKSFRYFWQASHQQVYRELARLTEQGFVTFSEVSQPDRPAKKVYTITPRGREELLHWLRSPTHPKRVNDELLVRIWAGELMGIRHLREEMARQRRLHEEKLSTYLAIEKKHFSPEQLSAASAPRQFRYLTLRKGILAEQAWITWSMEVDEVLKAMEHPPGFAPVEVS